MQEKQSSHIGSGRNFIRSLIEQMEGQVQAGVERIDATVIQGYLARVSEAEESFLKAIDEQVPEIFKKMSDLKIDGGETSSRMTALETSLQDVAQSAHRSAAGECRICHDVFHRSAQSADCGGAASSASGCHAGGSVKDAAARDGRCHPSVGGAWAGPACRDRSVAPCQPLVIQCVRKLPHIGSSRSRWWMSYPPSDDDGTMNSEVDYSDYIGDSGPFRSTMCRTLDSMSRILNMMRRTGG